VAAAIGRSGHVATFALGDARGHKRSFAGGLSPLSRFFRQCGFTMCGKTTPERFKFENSPALVAGRFPGFVIDFKREHRQAESLVRAWVRDVVLEIDGMWPRLHDGRFATRHVSAKPDEANQWVEGEI
jgi:hypothetical protein